MLSRLFALMVLLALVLGGIYYWSRNPSRSRKAFGRSAVS